MDGADEGLPLRFAFQIIRERHIADHAAKSLLLETRDQAVLSLGVVGPGMDDFENARFGGGLGKMIGERPLCLIVGGCRDRLKLQCSEGEKSQAGGLGGE